jgi:hypothetical protein
MSSLELLSMEDQSMASYDVDRVGGCIRLTRGEGPFGLPVSAWDMSPDEAERVSKILAEAVKAMRKRDSQSSGG